MGLHIIVRKVTGWDEDGYLTSYNCENEIKHDGCRYSWDKEFSAELLKSDSIFKPISIEDKCGVGYYNEKDTYVRICDFEAARKWVGDTVTIEGNRTRLYNLLDCMELDKDIYLDFSY